MNKAELKKNIEKIKQLLTHPDYGKIDAGIELAVSLEEPKIFETLLDGCSIIPSTHFERAASTTKFSRPKLNEWMKELMILDGELNIGTGYYVFLSLWLNIKDDSNIHESLNKDSLKDLSLVNCYLDYLPSAFKSLTNLERLDLSENNFSTFPEEILFSQGLKYLIIHKNPLDDVDEISDNIKKLKSLRILLAGNCNSNEEFEDNLDWEREPIPKDFSPDIEIIDLGLDYVSRGFTHTAICGAQCRYEFHKSNLIIRDDRLNCGSCDDPDEFTFTCDVCSKFIAPFVWYEINDEGGRLYFDAADAGSGFNDDNYDSEQHKRVIPGTDNPIIGTVCLDCSENLVPISEKHLKNILPGERYYTDRYGDEQQKSEFYLISTIEIENEDPENSIIYTLEDECYSLGEVAEWNVLEYESISGEKHYAWDDEADIGIGLEFIQHIIDDGKDVKTIFISLMQEGHGVDTIIKWDKKRYGWANGKL
jgi:hypothetical protein